MIPKRWSGAIKPLEISGPWFLSSRMRVLTRVAAPAERQHEGQKHAPEPHVEPVTPTSVSGEGHGSVFFTRDRAPRILGAHAREKCVDEARMPKIMIPKRLAGAIIPPEISGPWFLSNRMRVLTRVAAPAGRQQERHKPDPRPHVDPERPREGPQECVFCKGSRAQRMFGAQAPLKCVQEARMTKLVAQSRFHTLFARV
jgi:hypothetical protein